MEDIYLFGLKVFPFPILDFYGLPLVIAVLWLLTAAERLRPLRRKAAAGFGRVLTNNGLAVTAFVVMRLALIPVVVAVAGLAHRNGFGLVKLLPVPGWAQAALALALLDYSMYLWHRANHRVGFLWRFHNVHHCDLGLDVSTALRFHFGEMILSVFVRSVQVAVIGAGPLLVLVYEVVLEISTAFHHSNLRLPIRLERALGWVFVTPRMHGIHHSVVTREADSNYSNLLSAWDRLHRTALLDVPQDTITIGVPGYRDAAELTFLRLLVLPFRKQRERPHDDEGATRKAGVLAE